MSLRSKYITEYQQANPTITHIEIKYLVNCLNSEDDHTGIPIYRSTWIPRVDEALDVLGYTTKWNPVGWEIRRRIDD